MNWLVLFLIVGCSSQNNSNIVRNSPPPHNTPLMFDGPLRADSSREYSQETIDSAKIGAALEGMRQQFSKPEAHAVFGACNMVLGDGDIESPCVNVEVELRDAKSGQIVKTLWVRDGMFSFGVKPNTAYFIIPRAPFALADEKRVSLRSGDEVVLKVKKE